MGSEHPVRVTANLHPSVVSEIDRLSAETGMTRATVIKHAIGFSAYMWTQLQEGSKILVEDQEGNINRVIPDADLTEALEQFE